MLLQNFLISKFLRTNLELLAEECPCLLSSCYFAKFTHNKFAVMLDRGNNVDYYKHKKMTIYGHIRKGRLNTHFIYS